MTRGQKMESRRTLTFAEAQRIAYKTATEKGWWDKAREVDGQIALMHSELSEALEEWRNPERALDKVYTRLSDGKPEGFGIELADCVIRILDTCAHYGIDLGEMVKLKMEFNATRPYRHGDKRG